MRLRLNAEARAIYRAIIGEIKSRLVLRGSEAYLESFYPTSSPEEILRRQEYLKEALPRISSGIKEELEKIRPIKFRREFLSDRVLLVDEGEIEKAEALGLCYVTTNPEEAREYPLVLSTVGYRIDVELSPADVAPELYVLPLWEARETLEALGRIGEITGSKSVAGELLSALSEFEGVVKRASLLDSLDEIVLEKERALNEEISRKLESFSLTLSGRELLDFLSQLRAGNYEAIFRHFGSVEEEILNLIARAEEELSEKFGVDVELFSREELYPVSVSPERIEELRNVLERELAVERYIKAREILERVHHLIPRLREELRKAEELDFLQAVKDFAEGFTFPEPWEGGFAFLRGRHLFIENPQPVSYVVGRKPEDFSVPTSENVGNERVVILTGANSGGKTSLLELIAQVGILFHMGFPVPAERAWLEPLEEIFLFKRKRSVYGAGAFETALRSFVRALRKPGRKLLLIDEFEAITEPGAAVKIIGELLKVAHEEGFYVVIVSHLGEDLKRELPFARVDGIEAKGLDENLNLIVDRQPVFGKLGRSTPELIVERLAKKSRGAERRIYERILGAFKDSV
ncbi:endonuclease MutS2 [Thermococcus sp.]|uniref:endonuclease MutS2 n=1 Tax=Thermococcus sp. TaxID=35749 RepID=UPI00261EF9E8|nr:endonuclease MutS2 [Thermococcus sp.]